GCAHRQSAAKTGKRSQAPGTDPYRAGHGLQAQSVKRRFTASFSGAGQTRPSDGASRCTRRARTLPGDFAAQKVLLRVVCARIHLRSRALRKKSIQPCRAALGFPSIPSQLTSSLPSSLIVQVRFSALPCVTEPWGAYAYRHLTPVREVWRQKACN